MTPEQIIEEIRRLDISESERQSLIENTQAGTLTDIQRELLRRHHIAIGYPPNPSGN